MEGEDGEQGEEGSKDERGVWKVREEKREKDG